MAKEPPKRIAFLLPNMGGGGAERVALTLIRGFLDRGHEVDLVLMEAKGELMELVPPEARIVDLKARRMRSVLAPLMRYLHERRTDALQARLWPLTAIAILAARIASRRTRVVTSDHAVLSRQYGHSREAMALLKATTRLLYPLAYARICVSEGGAADLARISGMPIERISVVHNPVVPPKTLATTPAVERLWSGPGKRILTVGNLKSVKSHELLIRAFAGLGREAGARLMIVGGGPLRGELEGLAQELGVAERVIMPGFAADPWPFYASADLFVLSSNHEGFGNVLIEALLAGLPIVSTDCPGGPRTILGDGRFGRLVPVGEVEVLSRAIAESLAKPQDPEPGRRHAGTLSGASVARYAEIMLS